MRLLTGSQVSQILRGLTNQDANHLLSSLGSGLAAYTREHAQTNHDKKLIHQPARTVFKTADKDTTLVMPVSDTSKTGVKVVTVPNAGPIAGAVTLYSPAGELQGVLNAAEITAFRTALAVMTLLVKWPGTSKAGLRVVVFGAGKQVEWHVRLIMILLKGVSSVTVINRGKARLERLESQVLKELRRLFTATELNSVAKEGNERYGKQVEEKLAGADIICCCTPSREPLFSAQVLRDYGRSGSKKRFLSLIGSYTPEMQEIDTETLNMGGEKVYVDSKEDCLIEAGELIKAGYGEEKLIEVGEFYGEGEKRHLEGESELTIFKCVGFGLMDLIAARSLLEIAESKGIGLVVDDF